MIHLTKAGMGWVIYKARATLAQQSLPHILLYPNLMILGNGNFRGDEVEMRSWGPS